MSSRHLEGIPIAAVVMIIIGSVGFILDLVGIGGGTILSPIFWLGVGTLTLNALVRAIAEFRAEKAHEHRRITIPDAFFLVSVVAWGILILSIAINVAFVPTFAQVGHLKVGCYLTDALWFYVECRGFSLSALTAFFLSLPYTLWMGPVLLMWAPLIAVPLWFVLLLPAWYVWHRKRHV